MNDFLCHPGRTFTLREYEDHVEAMRKSKTRTQPQLRSVSDAILSPVVDPFELQYLSGLVQFYRIPNKVLFKLVRVATGHRVSDRWVAVRVILAKSIPIPVPKPLTEVLHA